MPRFLSPMIRKRQATDKLHPQDSVQPKDASTPQDVQNLQATIDYGNPQTEPAAEPLPPPDIRISEGSFKQIRDESLVLLSQGISHRIERSEEGPFQIFVEPDKRRAAQFQIRLYEF